MFPISIVCWEEFKNYYGKRIFCIYYIDDKQLNL